MSFRESAPAVFFNTKSKIYPDGQQRVTVCTRPIFKIAGWELARPLNFKPKPKDMTNKPRGDNIKRAKESVFDIAYCNSFSHFITFTLDKEKINRYDPKLVSQKLRKFLNNKVSRNGLKYVIIPEHHKDGAIHMHGLISGDLQFDASDRKTKDGRMIYNMPQWTLGYSTAIELDQHRDRVARYITKYVTKDWCKIFGNYYYAGGHGLIRKPPVQLYDTDYLSVNSTEYICEPAKLGFKYLVCYNDGE